MNVRSPLAFLLLAACFRATPLAPSSASGAGDAIEQTISGGRWQTSGSYAGQYRVVIRRDGHEEVRRHALLQWIEDQGQGIVVGRTIDLNELGQVYALSHPMIVRRGANWVLKLEAAQAPLTPYDAVVEFVLGDPGSVTLVRSPAPAFNER